MISAPNAPAAAPDRPAAVDAIDWPAVARTILTSRAIDRTEERELHPAGLVKYQFSAKGHELAQVLLGHHLDHPHDGATVYYRSRPFMLTAGLTPEEAMAATMARAGSPSGGRDIGVVFSLPPRGRQTILPMSGDVGAQYTPAVGWAHGIRYHAEILGDVDWRGAIAVALGGDGSCATPGFWASLNMAATGRLPMLFFIEDNGYAISVPATFQTPGANIAANLASYEGVLILDGDGTDPGVAAGLIDRAVTHVRSGAGPCLLRLVVPRLCGHSIQDNQSYKDEAAVQAEESRDPLPRLKAFLVPSRMDEAAWDRLVADAEADVAAARLRAEAQPEGDPATSATRVFSSASADAVGGSTSSPALPHDVVQIVGGTRPDGVGLVADWTTSP
ncbi:MAG: thiamine pyrophosphate-dependent enzyme, partial [Ardenticatenales bacterium]